MKKPLCWLFLFLLCWKGATAQQAVQLPPQKTNLLFVLDASGSMLAPWEGSTRIEAAKRLLMDMVDSLQVNPQVELGLRVYGHQSPRQRNDCSDSRLEVGFSANNHEAIKKALSTLQPKGNTPIAYSLEQAAEDFPSNTQYRNILILITDGVESCGGDPCAVALALQKKRIFLRPFVIALGAEEGMEQQFACMGDFYDASNLQRFRKALNTALTQSLGKTTLTVELLDEQNQPKQKDLNLTFRNSATGEVMYNFMHFRDSRGRPDTLMIDPVPLYDVVVNTLPPLIHRGVALKGGAHNTLRIRAAEATLHIKQPNHREYKRNVVALVRVAGHSQLLQLQPLESEVKYLAGRYDVEVLTTPATSFKGVELAGGQSHTLNLPAPGVLNVRSDVACWTDLYLLADDNQQELILRLDDKNSINSLALQPGNYRLVYRAKLAKGSKYTQVKDFSITSGKTVNLNLFGR